MVAFALTLLGSDVSARGHNMGKLEAFQKSDGLTNKQVNSPTLNRYYLGGAFSPGLKDLAKYPEKWAHTATKSGYWMHPMGFSAAEKEGFIQELLSKYAHKSYVYEMDLMGWTDGTNKIQTNFPWCWASGAEGVRGLEEIDPSYKMAFYAADVGGERVADSLEDVTDRYRQLKAKMSSRNYNNSYFFYSPADPGSLQRMDTLLNKRAGNLSFVDYVVTKAGLQGIALDFPAGLWMATKFPPSFPPNSCENAKRLAKQAYEICKRHGIPLVWVFNGGDADTAEAKKSIEKYGIYPSAYVVDNFSKPNRTGVPETDPASMSGQVFQML